jgi:hypothetical protein
LDVALKQAHLKPILERWNLDITVSIPKKNVTNAHDSGQRCEVARDQDNQQLFVVSSHVLQD